MRVDHEDGQAAFLSALASLRTVVMGLDDPALLEPSRCRGWARIDLLVHVHLGLQEMVLGLFNPASEPSTQDAASYWEAFPPSNDPEAASIDHTLFARRVGAAYRRPTGLLGHLVPTIDGLAAGVGQLADGALRFQDHVLTTGDWLATWAVELAVHHLDLDLPDGAGGLPDPAALGLVRRTVEALAGAPLPGAWSDVDAALIGTGRRDLSAAEAAAAGAVAQRLPVFG